MDSLGYGPRNALLAGMGYTSYAVYLGSPLWDEIRDRVMTARPGCALCRRRATVVHHDTYTAENLRGTTTDGLHPLCHGCHLRIECTKAGAKLPLHHVQKRFTARFKFREKELRKAVRRKARALRPLKPSIPQALRPCAACPRQTGITALTRTSAGMVTLCGTCRKVADVCGSLPEIRRAVAESPKVSLLPEKVRVGGRIVRCFRLPAEKGKK